MRQNEIEKLVKRHFIPHLSGWEAKRNRLFLTPIDQCFCGIVFETSGFNAERVTVDAIVAPLYMQPVEELYSLRRRLKSVGALKLDPLGSTMPDVLKAVQNEAIPILKQFDAPDKIAKLSSADPYELEAISMSFALIKDKNSAKAALYLAINGLRADGRKWCLEMIERLNGLLERMDLDFEAFQNEMKMWRHENLVKCERD